MKSHRIRAVLSLIALAGCLEVQAQGMSSSQINYALHCQGCHLPDGSGTPDKVPALKGEVGRFLHVAGGREFLVRVPGTSQSALTDAEVAAVSQMAQRLVGYPAEPDLQRRAVLDD